MFLRKLGAAGKDGEWRRVDWNLRSSSMAARWDVASGDRAKASENSTSFYVTEFGERWKAKELYYEFKELGELEVVIPPRRDRRGRGFGFVRFANVKDEKLLAIKLDNLVLDGRKLYANVPRYKQTFKKTKPKQGVREDSSDAGKDKGVMGAEGRQPSWRRFSYGGRQPFRSYAEVLHNNNSRLHGEGLPKVGHLPNILFSAEE